METQIHIKTEFSAVYLLNGTFVESAESFSYKTGESLYITVLPLSAHLLPYTVKIVGGRALCNEKLCAVFSRKKSLFVKLLPRYNYIYTPSKDDTIMATATAVERFFYLVKQKNPLAARKYLSEGLSATIDDSSLEDFFGDYTAIVKDDFNAVTSAEDSHFYLIDKNGQGVRFAFETISGLIDNITSEE